MMAEASTVDIESYKALVDRCARERLDHVISNGSPVHARVLISKLFETARHGAFIVSGKLLNATESGVEVYAYPDVVRAAMGFLRRPGSSLQIILEDPIDLLMENKFLASTINDVDRKGDVIVYPGTKAVNTTRSPHLMVTDALAYRLELDNKEFEAFANFGDDATAISVQNLFKKLEGYLHQLRKPRLSFSPGQRFALS